MKVFWQLGWFFKREWRRYVGAMIILVFVSVFELIPPMAVGHVVDGVVTGDISTQTLLWLLAGMLAIWGVVYLLRIVWRVWLFGAAAELGSVLRNRLYDHFTRQSPHFFRRYPSGDIMARSTNDVKAVVMTAGEGVLTAGDSIITGAAVLIVMVTQISWQLTILALLPMPVMAFLVNRFGRRLHHTFTESQAAFSELSEVSQSSLSAVRMVRAFGLEQHQMTQFDQVADRTGEKNLAVARVDALFSPVIQGTIGASFFFTVSGGGYLVATGQMSLGDLTAFTLYQGLMIWPMLAIAWLFNIIERGRAAWTRIDALMQEQPDIVGGEQRLPDQMQPLTIAIDAFKWQPDDSFAVKGLNITLNPGEMLGIAGPVGSGKSTLLQLLLHLTTLDKGDIRYGDVLITNADLSSWRQRFAVVTQTPFLFSRSIAENIALGRPDATQAEIEQAATLACIDEDIRQLPYGYETAVGEKGITLSGGQKQRISIARALLVGAECLILDDALSAVDGDTEHRILHNLQQHQHTRTTIVIAHRLSALENADEIVVLSHGQIRERGKHRQLIQQPGWYQEMHQYQQLEAALDADEEPRHD